jgi:competence protein ComEC
MNGLTYIVEHFNVGQLWYNGERTDTASYRRFLQVIKDAEIAVPNFGDLPRRTAVNGVELRILHPAPDFEIQPLAEKGDINNHSSVIRCQFGSVSLMFPGDILQEAEQQLVKRAGSRLQADVLLAPHHGSFTSSSLPFLDHVRPQVVIVSAGWRQRDKFPHPAILKRYQDRGSRVYMTHTHGAIEISTNGRSIVIHPTAPD